MAWAETVYGEPAEKQSTATDAPLPEPPEMFKADPAVLEAQLIVRGKSISRPITDGRVVR